MHLLWRMTFLFFLANLLVMSCITRNGKAGSKEDRSVRGSSKKPKRLTASQYKQWFQENGQKLHIVHDSNGIRYTAQFRPFELVMIENGEEQGGKSLSSQEEKDAYFVFWVQMQPLLLSASNERLTSKRKKISPFSMQQDFALVVDRDTLPCILFVPIQETFSINGQLLYQVGFRKQSTGRQNIIGATLVYNDRLYGAGRIQFNFLDKLFYHLPTLKQ